MPRYSGSQNTNLQTAKKIIGVLPLALCAPTNERSTSYSSWTYQQPLGSVELWLTMAVLQEIVLTWRSGQRRGTLIAVLVSEQASTGEYSVVGICSAVRAADVIHFLCFFAGFIKNKNTKNICLIFVINLTDTHSESKLLCRTVSCREGLPLFMWKQQSL